MGDDEKGKKRESESEGDKGLKTWPLTVAKTSQKKQSQTTHKNRKKTTQNHRKNQPRTTNKRAKKTKKPI